MAFPIRFFQNENTAQGIASIVGRFQAGISNVDNGDIPELGLENPWVSDPAASWLDYRCVLEVRLDPGMVLHKPLPQSAFTPDILSSVLITDPNLDIVTDKGINTKSNGKYTDFIQRMATSDYRFVLSGRGVRAGYKVPIPGLKSVCGVPATPDVNTRVRDNEIVANLGGIPIWRASWELWYMVALPPKVEQVPSGNPALHISGTPVLPAGIAVPISQPNQDSVPNAPVQNAQLIGQ